MWFNQVFGLSDELIAVRKVEVLDINSVEKDYWSKIISMKKIDFSAFESKRTGCGPLLKGWQVFSFFLQFWSIELHSILSLIICSECMQTGNDCIQVSNCGCSNLGIRQSPRRNNSSGMFHKFDRNVHEYWTSMKFHVFLQQAQRALLLESHRLCFMQIDKWFGMTMHQISDTEKDDDLQAVFTAQKR